MATQAMIETATTLHLDALVWDNHGCMPIEVDDRFLSDLARYKNAGVNVVAINVGYGDIPLEKHLRVLSFMRRWLIDRPDDYKLVNIQQP